MDNQSLAYGFVALFVAAIWIILLLWTIYKVLVSILNELRGMTRLRDPED